MSSNPKRERDPLRTGVFGFVLVICVVLIAFGYANLPFWPQGKTYDAYFSDAGGISPGKEVFTMTLRWRSVFMVSASTSRMASLMSVAT